MSEEKFVIKSELTTKATAALNQSVSEDLKEKDKSLSKLLKEQKKSNDEE